MADLSQFSRCIAYLESQSRHPFPDYARHIRRPAVTISRQVGARGRTIGRKLHDALNREIGEPSAGWTLLDRDLMTRVLEDNDLPKRLARHFPEDRVGEIDEVVGEILGLHPSLWTLFHKTTETIKNLAEVGNVILVGRGANVITAKARNVVHFRLMGSFDSRLKQVIEYYDYSTLDAAQFIKKEDRARRRYLKHHFQRDIDDPTLYDLVINTDRLSDESVVQQIGSLIAEKRRVLAQQAGA